MPLSPKLQYNVRVRIDSELGGNPAYTQIAVKVQIKLTAHWRQQTS